jgi:peptide/nickel transport system permease protein
MSADGKRTCIAAVRRILLAGVILFAGWWILLLLRRVIPGSIIDVIMPSMGNGSVPTLSHNTATWDWSKSLHENTKVSALIGPYIGNTLRAIALIALLSLLIAGALLLLGVLISAVTKRPAWLAKVRSVLRLILVSGGASIPVFVVSAFIAIYILRNEPTPQHPVSFFLTAFYCALLPAWLLVQTGYRLISNRRETTTSLQLAQQVSIRLLIRTLKLTGLIIVTTIMAGWFLPQPGLGTRLIDYLNGRDFPVIFGIVWVMVIIVVLGKLAAELIEIIYNHFAGQPTLVEPADVKPAVKTGIPKGWLIFSLGLCAVVILVAIFGPLFAPDPKMIHLLSRTQPPSSKFLLGTDQLGRDILSRLVAGIRTDILMGLGVAAAVSIIAGGWAMLAARVRKIDNWWGDTLGDIIMLPGDIICAFPWLALLLLLMDMSMRFNLWVIGFPVGLLLLPRAASMIQESRRSTPEGKIGQAELRSIPVVFLFVTAGVVLYVSALGWLGFGAPPGIIELGATVNSGNAYLQTAPWLVIAPSIVLVGILWIWVMTGEALLEKLGFRSGAFWSKTME